MYGAFQGLTSILFIECVLLSLAMPAQIKNPQIKIYVYNDARVPANILAHAELRATMIFSHAGLELNWVNCDHSTTKPLDVSCSTPEQIVLSIIPHAAGSNSDARFGLTFLDSRGRGRYSDVFWNKVQELHTEYKRVDMSEILGSVMAHEIGHLMLGSHSHAVSGIMRARWESNEVQQIARGNLLFLTDEEKQMRTTCASRLRLISEAKRRP